MDKLTFIKTVTVADFKAAHGNNSITIVKSPKSNKLFFECGTVTGAVSDNYKEAPALSQVKGSDDTPFWLLHKKGTDNVVDTL